MSKYLCQRKECSRVYSEFNILFKRKRPLQYEGKMFCSDSCLRLHVKSELSEKWRIMQEEKVRVIPRLKLGTILMQTALVTRSQIEEALRRQSETGEGRIGEWLLRLGFVKEHQIVAALAQQFRLPLIDLKNSTANKNAVRMIPGKVARCSGIIPVGFDDDKQALQIAVCAPMNLPSQDAIRRMVNKRIVAYIGNQSAIEQMLERWYDPEELDLSRVPTFTTLDELLQVGYDIISTAQYQRALNVRAELVKDFFWVRLDFRSKSHHHLFRYRLPHHHHAGEISGSKRQVEYAVH